MVSNVNNGFPAGGHTSIRSMMGRGGSFLLNNVSLRCPHTLKMLVFGIGKDCYCTKKKKLKISTLVKFSWPLNSPDCGVVKVASVILNSKNVHSHI